MLLRMRPVIVSVAFLQISLTKQVIKTPRIRGLAAFRWFSTKETT